MSDQPCVISENQIQPGSEKFQCVARLREKNQRCQRTQTVASIKWKQIGLKFFPLCTQHSKNENPPVTIFDKRTGYSAPVPSPVGAQGFAIGPNCLPVRRDIKQGEQLDVKDVKGTTCWKDFSISKSKAVTKAVHSCQQKMDRKKKKKGKEDEKKTTSLPLIPLTERAIGQEWLTKTAAKSPLYDALAMNVLKKISQALKSVFGPKATLVLKGSRAIRFALEAAFTRIEELQQVFPFLVCDPKQKAKMGEVVAPSDFDAQLVLDYPVRLFEKVKQVAEGLILNEYYQAVTSCEENAACRSFFQDLPLVENTSQNLPLNVSLHASTRQSFQMGPNMQISSNFTLRRFLALIPYAVLEKSRKIQFRLPLMEDLKLESSLKVSFGYQPDIYTATRIKNDLYECSIPIAKIKFFKKFQKGIPLLEVMELKDVPESQLYFTLQHLRILEKSNVRFSLLRLMAFYLIQRDQKDDQALEGKTKAEIVDIGIISPKAADYQASIEHFIKHRREYAFDYEGLQVGSLKYHEHELLRLLSESRGKKGKDLKRIDYIYTFICCISRLANLRTDCKNNCGVPAIRNKRDIQNLREQIVEILFTYGGLKWKEKALISKTLYDLPVRTLQFIYVFVEHLVEKLTQKTQEEELEEEKNQKDPKTLLQERQGQVHKIITFFHSLKKDACYSIEIILQGLRALFDVDFIEQETQKVLGDLFRIHGYEQVQKRKFARKRRKKRHY